MANEKDDVLLKLVIQGQSPAEIAALAQQTGGQLEAAMRGHLDRLTELHKQAGAAQTAEAVKATQAQIKAEQTKLSAVKQFLEADRSAQEKVAAQAEKTAQQVARAAEKKAAAEQKAVDQITKAANKAAEEWEKSNNRAMTAAEKAAVKQAAEAEKTASAQERAAKAAANATSNAWRRTMEDLENFTTVATGAVNILTSIASQAKAFGEEMVRVNQVLRSAGGGPSAFAISNIVGDITAYDITIARNKALQAELKLTDQDFLKMAQAASELSDQMGISGGDALNAFIDAINTGRTRMLASIGVVVNAEEVYKRLEIQLGRSKDAIDEQTKKLALQDEIISQLSKRAPAGMQNVVDMSDQVEKSFTSATNSWHRFLQELGSFKVPSWITGDASGQIAGRAQQLEQELGQQLSGGGTRFGTNERVKQLLADRKHQSDVEFLAAVTDDKVLKEQLKLIDGLRAERSAKLRAQLGIESEASLDQERELMESAGEQLNYFKTRFGPDGGTQEFSAALMAANKKTAEQAKALAKTLAGAKEAVARFFDEFSGIVKEQKDIDPIEAVLFVNKGDKAKLVKDYLREGESAFRHFYAQVEASRQEFLDKGGLLPKGDKTIDELTANLEASLRGAQSIEQRIAEMEQKERDKRNTAFADDYAKTLEAVLKSRNVAMSKLSDATDNLSGIAGTEVKFKVKESDTKEDIEAQAADINAIVAQYNPKGLRGEDLGPLGGLVIPVTLQLIGQEKTVEEFKDVAREVNESVQAMQSMVTTAYTSMAQAVGQSFAAQISGSKEARKSFRDTTHDILEALSAQALTQAIFETAKGIAATAAYIESYGADVSKSASAVEHFAAAAAFGAVGVGAGLAARAVGKDAAPASASGGGLRQTGQGFNNPRSGNDNGQQDQQKLPPIQVFAFPGGEEAAGRAVVKAITTLEAQDGIKRLVAY